MSSSSSSSSGGIGMLGILFIALKLTGVINWSWWYVTLPLWGGIALFMTALILWAGWVVIAILIKKKAN